MSQKVRETLISLLIIVGTMISVASMLACLFTVGDPAPGYESIAYKIWACNFVGLVLGFTMVQLGLYLDNKFKENVQEEPIIIPETLNLTLLVRMKKSAKNVWER